MERLADIDTLLATATGQPTTHPLRRRTLLEWLGKYERYLSRTASRSTYLNYSRQLYVFLKHYRDKRYPDQIFRSDIEDYKMHMVGQEYHPRTINQTIKMVSAFYSWLQDVGDLPVSNPARKSKQLLEPTSPRRALQNNVLQQLIAAATDPEDKLWLLMASSTGLRAGTLDQLEWSEVDLENKLVNIRGEKFKNKHGKILPLRPDVVELLRARQQPSGEVFKRSASTIRNRVADICKSAGLPHVKLHDLRHTFATNMIRAGADIHTVQELLGHSSLETTAGYLETADLDEIRQLQAKLPQ